jgi:formylglycine-generating enzyme required for sulfatase activity
MKASSLASFKLKPQTEFPRLYCLLSVCLILGLGCMSKNTPAENTPNKDTLSPAQVPQATLGLSFPQAETPIAQNSDWQAIIQPINGVEMVLVPAGCFMMGSPDPLADSDERPVQEVCFDRPFWLDRYEVSNAQYGSVGCAEWSSAPDQARNCLNWLAAQAHCASRGARLPTEAEWEYAARGPDAWHYPWGEAFVGAYVVWRDNAQQQVAPVGSRPAGDSWVGAADMSGNVWEWMSTLYRPYPYHAGDGREDQTNRTDVRSVRGGSWYNDDIEVLGVPNRDGYNPTIEYGQLGLRCAAAY